MLAIKGTLFTKPLSLTRIGILGFSVLSILFAGVLPFSLFLYASLPFQTARYLGSFMFYAGLAVMLYVGLTTQFKPNWKLRRQAITLSALVFVALATFAVVEAPAVNALTPLPTDRGVNNSAPYKFSVPFTEYQWIIAQFRDGTYYAINGSDWNIMTIVEPWQSVPPWAALSTNKTALIQQALSVTTAGKILLNELTFPYSCTIPTNVAVIESYRGLTRQFISSANTQGSPYTISIDTVNAGYYLAQDGQGRFLDEWSSTNASYVFQSAVGSNRTVQWKSGSYTANTKLLISGYTDLKLVAEKGTVITLSSSYADNAWIDELDEWTDPGAAGRCVVDGFTINCNGKGATGIHFHRSSNTQIINNEVYGSTTFGIAACGHNLRIAHNFVHNITGTGVGIYADVGYNMVIEENYVRDVDTQGIVLASNAGGKVIKNLLYNAGTAIADDSGTGNLYEGNQVLTSTNGIYLTDANQAIVKNNIMETIGYYAVVVKTVAAPTKGVNIESNRVTGTSIGVLLYPTNSQQIQYTSIKENTFLTCSGYGVQYASGGGILNNINLYYNTYISCGTNVDLTSATNATQTDWVYP